MDDVVVRGGLGQRPVRAGLAKRRVLVIVSFHNTENLSIKVKVEYCG
jgi:hypothetical protein